MNLEPEIFPKEQRRYIAFFLNLLHWKWICWQADDQGYVHLKREYITRVIPSEIWYAIRDELVINRVLHHYKYWTQGKQSQGYRIAPKYRETKKIVCHDEALARRIREVYASESVPLIPVHHWLEEKLNLIEFDVALAKKIIPTLQPDEDSSMTVEEYRQLLTEACKRIAYSDFWFRCDRFGRVHTNITSLKKELRCCLTVGSQRLVGLDLANSQPLIAGLVAQQFLSSNRAAVRLRDRVFNDRGNPYHRRHLERCDTNRPDLVEYLRVCEAGKFYESMMENGDDRDRIKCQSLTMFYGKNHWAGPLKTRFTDQYPSVAEMLSFLKSRSHAHAAHIMQNTEAVIFIHSIAERIRLEEPDIPIFTIHDSILTTPENLDYVRDIIMQTFEQLGVHPKLKTE